jgi:hypothetical protein
MASTGADSFDDLERFVSRTGDSGRIEKQEVLQERD